jgi:hypothetical protein
MVSRELQTSASALTSIAAVIERDPTLLVDLVPLLATGFVLLQREMVLHLLDTEPDWPWS